jgi:hypothetical protein
MVCQGFNSLSNSRETGKKRPTALQAYMYIYTYVSISISMSDGTTPLVSMYSVYA